MKVFKHIITASVLAGLWMAQLGAQSCAQAREVVTVFAAASLKNALDALVVDFSDEVVVSYGGSAILARQVALGAPADIVILANSEWMSWLVKKGAVIASQHIDLLGNSLVVIGPRDAPPLEIKAQDLAARLIGGRLAIGQTTGVPAGIYGRAWLENAGLWADVANSLAEVENVRVALALVARGEAPFGVVYASDALAEPRVSVVYQVPENLHPEITYPAAVLTPKGQAFYNYLTSEHAKDVFSEHGFMPRGVAP